MEPPDPHCSGEKQTLSLLEFCVVLGSAQLFLRPLPRASLGGGTALVPHPHAPIPGPPQCPYHEASLCLRPSVSPSPHSLLEHSLRLGLPADFPWFAGLLSRSVLNPSLFWPARVLTHITLLPLHEVQKTVSSSLQSLTGQRLSDTSSRDGCDWETAIAAL